MFDGVCADFVRGFYEIANPLFGTSFQGPQRTWDFKDEFTPEQIDYIWGHIKGTRDFWQKLRPLEGVGGLRRLPKNVEPVFITSRVPTLGHSVHDQTCHWLRQNFYITYPLVIVVDDPREKVALCKNLGLDNFIDDKRQTVLQMHEAGLRSYAKLALYNSDQPFPEGVVPVESLDEYLELELGGKKSAT